MDDGWMTGGLTTLTLISSTNSIFVLDLCGVFQFQVSLLGMRSRECKRIAILGKYLYLHLFPA